MPWQKRSIIWHGGVCQEAAVPPAAGLNSAP